MSETAILSAENLDLMRDQHAHLHELMIQFEQLAGFGEDGETTLNFFARLIQVLCDHFETEETLMQSCEFPGFEMHRRQHQAILTELGLIGERLQGRGTASNALRSAIFLTTWYQRHQMMTDGEFINFYREKVETTA